LEARTVRSRLLELDEQISQAVEDHPDGPLIRSLPGMGVALTAEFLAEAGGVQRFPTPDASASAAGLAPVLQQSGKCAVCAWPTRATKPSNGSSVNRRSAPSNATQCRGPTTTENAKKANDTHQALIALARRRINVLHAMLRARTKFDSNYQAAA
jgi:transposase